MRFRINEDSGDVIRGWVAPDNPLAISRVCVSVGGRRVAEVPASAVNAGVLQNGWHATGECEFVLDEACLPGLAGIRDLEIYDVDTNLLVHRRSSIERLCQGKFVFINTGINSENTIQTTLFPHFLLNYFNIDRFSEQIMSSILNVVDVKSLFVAGNIFFPRYESLISLGEMVTATLVHDPYVEMASRLIWLRDRGALIREPHELWRVGALAEAAIFARNYDYTDIRQVRHFLRMLPQAAYHLLYNPLTRQLGTYNPDDHMIPSHSVIAVEVLARIGIAGHRNHFQAFVTTIYDRLGIDAPVPAPPPIPAETLALAEQLRSIKAARDFVVFDAAISDGVQRSVGRNWSD